MLNFEQTNGHFPPGGWGYHWIGDPDRGTGLDQPGGWFFSILPHIEQLPFTNSAATAMRTLGGRPALRLGGDDPDAIGCSELSHAAAGDPVSKCVLRLAEHHAGANPSPTMARSDYAACAGDQYNGENDAGPTSLAAAATLSQNHTWPNVENGTGSPLGVGSSPATGIGYLRSLVKMCDITDGTTNTYLLGEKYLSPDRYFDGLDWADNESLYNGADNDLMRTTYYQGENPPSHLPMQDTAGYPDYYRFGSATPSAATWRSATARFNS